MPVDGHRPPDVGALYAEHAKRVHRWVMRFYGRDEAEEVVHEIFVKVLERIDSFRHDASATTWLYRLTVNHCLNRLRNEGRRAQLWLENPSLPWMTAAVTAEQTTVTFLRQFWQQLGDELVTIAFHYFVDGMTHAEIARVLGCSPRTVGNRLEELRHLAQVAAGETESAQLLRKEST